MDNKDVSEVAVTFSAFSIDAFTQGPQQPHISDYWASNDAGKNDDGFIFAPTAYYTSLWVEPPRLYCTLQPCDDKFSFLCCFYSLSAPFRCIFISLISPLFVALKP